MINLKKIDSEVLSSQVGVAQLQFSSSQSLKCILGSCVSVVLFSGEIDQDYSSMSHYLLAIRNGSSMSLVSDENKFGDVLIEKQIQGMEESIGKKNMKAMIFGGARIKNYMKASLIAQIGEKNIEIARKTLQSQQIEIISMDVGGETARYVEFNPVLKSAHVRRLKNNEVFYYSFKK